MSNTHLLGLDAGREAVLGAGFFPVRSACLTKHPPPPFSQWLRQERLRKRFSVRELGEAAGLSGAYISQLESGYDVRNGKRLDPSPKIILMLAEALAEGDELAKVSHYRTMMREAGHLPSEFFPELEQAPVDANEPLAPNALQLAADLIEAIRRLPDDHAARLRALLEESEPADIDIEREPRIVE